MDEIECYLCNNKVEGKKYMKAHFGKIICRRCVKGIAGYAVSQY